MAAYAAVVSAARTLEERCNDDINFPSLDHKEEVEIFKSLLQHFISLQSFLEDFPEEAEELQGRIRDVAYRAEDVIEDFMLKSPAAIGSDDQDEEFCDHFQDLIISQVYLLKVIAQEINSIEEEVATIKSRITRGVLVQDSMKIDNDYSVEAPAPSRDVVVGFEDQLMAIKSKLHGESSKELKVIPMFGMGGIGKTTLARNAFDDSSIRHHFDFRAWATVSQAYSVREIFLNLLVSGKVFKEKTSNESDKWLKECLYRNLKGRRYLIVLDDVWSTEALDEVTMMFPDDENGSRVLLTTRLSEVADYAVGGSDFSNSIHSMRFLNADQSWNLLREKVFSSYASHDDDSDREALEEIGMEIASRCGGLPLTIVIVAGILQNVSRTRAAWEEISWKVNAESNIDERVANVLALSYKHLPQHLRPCFLYMASFPEDYEVLSSELSRMWIAEGFLKRSSNSKSFEEETAEEYLEDLVRRSLVLVVRRNIGGGILSCGLHDLLRDLCIRKSQEEKFPLRHVSTDNIEALYDKISPNYPTAIRSILSFEEIDTDEDDDMPDDADAYNHTFSITPTRLLRVIHAPAIISSRCSAVLHLFHLRYLRFKFIGCGGEMPIPEDIYKFKKLQTFDVPEVDIEFPFNIWKMPQLRHFHVYSLRLPSYDAETTTTFTTLENLQTLSEVYNLVCTKAIMNSMPNLKKLKLFYQEMDLSKFEIKNLVHLCRLESLDLVVSLKVESVPHSFEKLALPTSLKNLSLCHCMIPWEKIGFICSSLPNLQDLQLTINACWGQVWETEEGQFPQLKKLEVGESDLQQWITESNHFPCLEHLSIYGCSNLLEVPNDIQEISTLQFIDIENCSESLVESAKLIEIEQEDMGNEDLRLQIFRYEDSGDGYRENFEES